MTPKERRAEYGRVMGAELGGHFYELTNELAHLHLKWRDFVILYGTNPERIALLNKAAPGFFYLLNETLWDDVVLHLSRLIDRDTRTLSTRQLPRLVPSVIRRKVKALFNDLEKKTRFVVDRRNRHIAHRQRDLAIGDPKAVPLTPGSRQDVRAAITALVEFLNAISMHFGQGAMAYEFTAQPGDADALLRVLHRGVTAGEEEARALKVGRLSAAAVVRNTPEWLKTTQW
jgi:hypothetical protein